MVFHPSLIHIPIIKAAEFRGQAAERPNERKLRREDVNDKAEAYFPRKRERILGFTLHLRKLFPRREKITDKEATASRPGKVTYFVRDIKGATYEIATGPDMSRPGHDDISENRIHTRAEALQSTLLDQVIAELTKSQYCAAVVAEKRTRNHGEPQIGNARAVAVAVLEAEIHHPANDKGRKIVVAVVRRHDDFVQDVHGVEDIRVGHQRQVKEFLGFSASELRPDPIVLPHYFLASRVHRPIGAAVPEVFESYLDTAVALTQNFAKRHTQTCDERDIESAFGTLRQHQKPIFRRSHVSAQQFTLGHMRFDSEDEIVLFVPSLFGQQCPGSVEVRKRRGVCCRALGALARNEIQFGEPLTFPSRRDEVRSTVQLIDDVKDPLFQLLGRN